MLYVFMVYGLWLNGSCIRETMIYILLSHIRYISCINVIDFEYNFIPFILESERFRFFSSENVPSLTSYRGWGFISKLSLARNWTIYIDGEKLKTSMEIHE